MFLSIITPRAFFVGCPVINKLSNVRDLLTCLNNCNFNLLSFRPVFHSSETSLRISSFVFLGVQDKNISFASSSFNICLLIVHSPEPHSNNGSVLYCNALFLIVMDILLFVSILFVSLKKKKSCFFAFPIRDFGLSGGLASLFPTMLKIDHLTGIYLQQF